METTTLVVVAMRTGLLDTMPFVMQFFQQLSLHLLCLEGRWSSLILCFTEAVQLMCIYPAGRGPSSSLRCNCYIDHATRLPSKGLLTSQGPCSFGIYHPRGCYLPRSCSFGWRGKKIGGPWGCLSSCGSLLHPYSCVKTLGGMSASSVSTLACLGRLLGQRLGIPPADSIRHLF